MSNDNAIRGPRIISKASDRGEEIEAADARAISPDDATTTSLESHTYEVYWVPDGCSYYDLGDYIDLMVQTPPPAKVTLAVSGACNGTKAKFVE